MPLAPFQHRLARSQPGRITYPRPPNFHGTTFIKQALIEHAPHVKALTQPVTAAALEAQAAPLWRFLDALHPHLWRGGKQFPQNSAAQRQMWHRICRSAASAPTSVPDG